MLIQNRDDLLSHGDVPGRRAALDLLEAGVQEAGVQEAGMQAVDPYANTRKLICREGDKLSIGGHPPMDVSGSTTR